MATLVNFSVSPYVPCSARTKPQFRVRVQSLGGGDSTVLSSDSAVGNGTPLVGKKEKNGAVVNGGIGEKEKREALVDGGNGGVKPIVERKLEKDAVSKELEVLWDDGYGTMTVKDYFDGAKEISKPDDGPPRWFCPVECGQPIKDSPVLLFCPGLDGVGLGLVLHHKALGKVFEVRCLHIPVYDRTSFEGLVKLVEETVRIEHAISPNKPIYLLGDSFGGCLALAVAACNPNIDLILVLTNPATSFDRSQLQQLFPLLDALPDQLHVTVPYLLSCVMGNPMKMAMVDIEHRLPGMVQMDQLASNLSALLPYLSGLSDIIPKETLFWKLKLLKSAAAYANSRLHAVKAEVLVLSSGQDYMLPSKDEAQRLKDSLQNCKVRSFKDNGHTILLEDGVNLLTIIKGTGKYRRSRRHDFVADFVPPSRSEFRRAFDEVAGLLNFATGSAMFSTLDDGKIVRGLAGVPNEGPVLLVGYHMLMGFDVYSLVEEFLKEKNIVPRGLAHPVVFAGNLEGFSTEFSLHDWMKVMGAVPVTGSNLFKLLSTNSHVLLYPGGAREAMHYKGEKYKLFWPDQQEFVRMAARFGATIVPFGTVGEDDLAELVLDYNDLMQIPILNDYIRELQRNSTRIGIRDESKGEVASQELFIPGLLPKLPGRCYYLFGKPIETRGREEEILKDKEKAGQLYLQTKSEVEHCISYLLQKRDKDPYRNVIDRTVYRALYSPVSEVPAFEP